MSVPAYETLSVSVRDRVCWLELNRPQRKNAINFAMYREVVQALQFAAANDAVHVLVLTGHGDTYSSGNDLNNLIEGAASGDLESVAARSCDVLVAFVDAFINFPKALIVAVNGPAHGIAVTTALLGDLVYCSDTATFTTPFTRLGQNPEGCSTLLFPALLGQKANRMLLLGETLTAQEANQHNMVSDVFPARTLRDEVHVRAVKIAGFPLHSVMASKQLVRRQTSASLMKANRDEANVLKQLLLDPRTHEAVMSQMQKMATKHKAKL